MLTVILLVFIRKFYDIKLKLPVNLRIIPDVICRVDEEQNIENALNHWSSQST
jgi:hypothetical protein